LQGHIAFYVKVDNKLSEERAKKIYDLLIEHGIEEERLSYKGMGSHYPINGNMNHEGNRRVEVLRTK